mgnify:CR=1 FL=1
MDHSKEEQQWEYAWSISGRIDLGQSVWCDGNHSHIPYRSVQTPFYITHVLRQEQLVIKY